MKSLRFILIGIIAGSLAVVAWTSFTTQRQAVQEIETLRANLFAARASADSCRLALASEEEAFLVFDSEVDSLKSEVRAYEDPEAGGVPEEDYAEYLERFEGYNDSVGIWEDRAAALKENEAACMALVESHNQLSDSLRRRFPSGGGS